MLNCRYKNIRKIYFADCIWYVDQIYLILPLPLLPLLLQPQPPSLFVIVQGVEHLCCNYVNILFRFILRIKSVNSNVFSWNWNYHILRHESFSYISTRSTLTPQGSVASSNVCSITWLIVSLSDKISAKCFVPNTFLSVVAASKWVEWLKKFRLKYQWASK